jgi:hypothetical protein
MFHLNPKVGRYKGAIRHSYGTNDKKIKISCIPFNAKTG